MMQQNNSPIFQEGQMKLNVRIGSKSNKLQQFKPFAHFSPIRYSTHHTKIKKLNLNCFSIDLQQKGVNFIEEARRLEAGGLHSKSEAIKTQPSRNQQLHSEPLPIIYLPHHSVNRPKQKIRSRQIINAIQKQKEREMRRQQLKLKVLQQLQGQRRSLIKQFDRLEVQYIRQLSLSSKKHFFNNHRQTSRANEKPSQSGTFQENSPQLSSFNNLMIKEKIRRLSINEKQIVINLDRKKNHSKFFHDKLDKQ